MACRRGHHFQLRHILAAKALRGNGYLHLVALCKAKVNDRRSIVARIDSFKRIGYYRAAQPAVYIALRNAAVERLVDVAADKVDVLSDLHKDDCHSRILTDRYGLLSGNVDIVDYIAKDILSHGGLFKLRICADTVLHIPGKVKVCLYAELSDELLHLPNIYLPNSFMLLK